MTTGAKKSVLIVAAPFGFGPASKAWLLSEALHTRYALTVNVQGPAAEFLRANLAPGIRLAQGKFGSCFPDAAALAGYDAFVAINHVPALRQLDDRGLIDRAIFIDSLSHWRTEVEGSGYPQGLLAHLVQDYPASSRAAASPPQPGAITVAPMMAPGAKETRPAERSGIVVHTGGLTNSLPSGDTFARAVSALFGTVLARTGERGEPVSFLGNPALFAHVAGSQDARHLPGVSPAAATEAIAGARLLITTPGIGAVYEAMACGTPTILLPPTNSTQSYHFDVLTGLGLAGTIEPANQRAMRAVLNRTDWSQHSTLLLTALARDATRLLARLDHWLDVCLDERRADERAMLVERARGIFAALSTTPAEQVIDKAIATLAPR